MAFYIGIDIGGTNTACGIVDEDCRIIARSKVKTNPKGDGAPNYADALGCSRGLRGGGTCAVRRALDRYRVSGYLQQ